MRKGVLIKFKVYNIIFLDRENDRWRDRFKWINSYIRKYHNIAKYHIHYLTYLPFVHMVKYLKPTP